MSYVVYAAHFASSRYALHRLHVDGRGCVREVRAGPSSNLLLGGLAVLEKRQTEQRTPEKLERKQRQGEEGSLRNLQGRPKECNLDFSGNAEGHPTDPRNRQAETRDPNQDQKTKPIFEGKAG